MDEQNSIEEGMMGKLRARIAALEPLERERLAEALATLLYGPCPETPEEVDAFLRSQGIDPEALAAKAQAWAQKALGA